MTSTFLTLNATDFKSAFITIALTSFIEAGTYIVKIGNIFQIDGKTLLNLFVIAVIVGVISLAKNLLTTSSGKFLGAVKVKEVSRY